MEKSIEKQLEENIINDINSRLTRKNGAMRVIASLLDFFFVTIVMGILAITVSFPIANNMGLAENGAQATLIIARSNLYELAENNAYIPIQNENNYPEAIYHFYVDDFDTEKNEYIRGVSPILVEGNAFNTEEDYYTVILKKGSEESLFDFSITPDKPWNIKVKEGKQEAVKAFYTTAYGKALNDLNANEKLIDYTYKFIGGNIVTVVLTYVIAALPLYLIVPLLTKDGVTLGKLLTNTSIANKYGYNLTKSQAFFRGLTGYVLYYLFFFIPFGLASLIMIAFTKSEKTLTDYIAYTVVLDKRKSIIYKDAVEEKYYNIVRAKNLVQIRKRQAEVERDIVSEKKLNN